MTISISGEMPKRKQTMHACVAAFIFVIFAAAALVNGQFLWPSKAAHPEAMRIVSLLFIVLSCVIIAMVTWYRRRIIREFDYDGATLHYRTLSGSERHSRLPSQLLYIREWAGKGGLMGYQLIFRDAPKAYIEDTTPNSTELIELLLQDMAAKVKESSVERPSGTRQ